MPPFFFFWYNYLLKRAHLYYHIGAVLLALCFRISLLTKEFAGSKAKDYNLLDTTEAKRLSD